MKKKNLFYAIAFSMICSVIFASPVTNVSAASGNSMSVSVTSSKVKIKITKAKSKGTLYAYNANEYAKKDKIRGISKSVKAKGTALGKVSKGQSKTITVNRYDANGRDGLYNKYYLLNGNTIVKGPIYATSIASAKKSIGFTQKSVKGLYTEGDASNIKYAKDLGVSSITLNIDLGTLMYASKSVAPADATPYQVNGQTYYFNTSAVNYYDSIIKKASAAKMNVIGILIAWTNKNYNTYAKALRYNSPKSTITMGQNTSNATGRDDFIAMIEFLAHRYSQSKANGYISTYVLGNEIDFTHYWYNTSNFNKFMEEYSRALRLSNLAIKKYAGNVKVAVPYTHYWAKSAGQVFKECPGPSFAPLKMTNWLAKTSKAQGNYDWALAPHCYGVVNTKAQQTLTDSSMKVLTGNYKTTKELTFTNLEVLNSYLNTSALKYKGKQRSVYLTECGASSGKISNKNLKYQAATLAYEYYKVAHLPFVKSFNYYRLKDEASEAKNGLSVGLLKSNGSQKPAYKVYKHIDTKSSQAWTKGYLKYISYKRNGKGKAVKPSSWKASMNVYKTSFNWNKKWSWKKITKR